MADAGDRRRALSAQEAETVLATVADAAVAGLPLADGLRAAADEAGTERLAAELRRLAAELDQGRSLEEIFTAHPGRPHAYLNGLLRAGARTGSLELILREAIDQQQRLRELRTSLASVLIYPAVLLALALGMLFWVDRSLVGSLLSLFDEETRVGWDWMTGQAITRKLPAATRALIAIHETGVWWFLFTTTAAVAGLSVVRIAAGAATWRRLTQTIPLVGVFRHWCGVAEWAQLLSLLLRREVSLPEALRLAAAGGHDANLSEISRTLARSVEQGRSLAESLTTAQRLPATVVPLVRWGEGTGQLPEALRVIAEVFEGRVAIRAELLRAVLPAGVFVIVGMLVLLMVAGLYLPMIDTLRAFGSFTWSAPARTWYEEVGEILGQLSAANCLGFVILGAAVLCAVRLIWGPRHAAHYDRMRLGLRLAGWILVTGGLLVLCVLTLGPLSLVPAAALVALNEARSACVVAERRSLLWALTVAAEHGLPLAQTVRAFAEEGSVQASRRYIRLADLLEAGIPLAQAFARARQTLPTDALLATRLASESPNAGAALRMSLVYNGYFTATTRKVLSACLYLFVLVFVGGPVLVFLLSNILPMIERIAFESRVSPASVTPGVLWTQVVLLTPLLLMGLWGFAYSVGWSRHELPWFRRFWLRCDSALVLRALALAVRQSLTIGPAVALLARQYPKASVARRLARSAGEVERGVHRCEALCGAGLIRQVEVAVLRAAERAGNLAWALDEMADSVLRRFTLRLRGVLAVLFPACVVAFGLSMALVGARVVLPIVEMLRACDY